MKRFLSSILALCMLAALLSGCGAGNNAETGTQMDGERTIKDEIIFAQGSDLTSMDPP